ncbi:MAG: YkgJ family cysteine cluster protein [Dechloromonas sp.]|nr:YkgJ family cysteine cluster protein [Dechloromonas sp.]
MSSRRSLATELAAAAAAYQTADVIPHCTQCAKPCCKLDALVLEMEWKQIKTLWKINDSRAVFDKRLAAGEGPQEIRESEGLYFVHSKPCPAYDQAGGSCQIYGQALKPVGCSDFPVYEDRGSIMADLRCEAVDLKALTARLARTLGPDVRIVQSADREFPFLVTLSVRSSGHKRK